jgi:prophage tail gpP-like protein
MAIYTKLLIKGTQYYDALSIRVTKSMSENNSCSSVSITFDNIAGQHQDTFNVGDEILVYADKDVNPAVTKVFSGIIEDIDYRGSELKETITLTGRDYSVRLMDETIEPTVYNNQEISTIVTDIIDNFTQDLTRVNVDVTSVTLNHIAFNHTNVFDALKQLADLAGFIFYVDVDKDVHFELKGSISSGLILNNTNCTSCRVKESRKELYNKVWVYGGETLTNYENVFTANGGSVYTLDYKPHNTQVLIGGSTAPKVGGIYDILASSVGSPTQYLVDFDQKRIIFVSGTDAGNNIPVSGTDTIDIFYDRGTTIAKFGQDDASIALYGPQEKVIIDKNIINPTAAQDTISNTLERYSSPLKQATLVLQGVFSATPSNTCIVDFPFQGIGNETFDIIQVVYDFSVKRNLIDEVTTITVSRRIADVLDTLKQLILDVKKLQAETTISAEIFTRLLWGNEKFGFIEDRWTITTRTMGSSFVLGHLDLGRLGSVTSPQPYLGDSRGPSTIIISGGTWT